MKLSDLRVTRYGRTLVLGLFLIGVAAALILWTARTEAFRADASGCPYLAQASSAGCPHMAGEKHSGCPHMAASKASGCPCMAGAEESGCPYLAGEKDCLHALRHSLRLEEKQMEVIRGVQERFLEESADLKKGIREAGAELDRLFRSPDARAEEITEKSRSLTERRERLEEMALDFRLRIRAELTQEQLDQIPEGCWHSILAYGHGYKYKGGCCKGAVCPYNKPAASGSDVPS
jgi:hypothetical protein